MIAKFISFLKFSILLTLNLNGIVCEVYHIVHVAKVKLVRTGSDIPEREPIKFTLSSDKDTKHESSNIEFATIVK